MRNTIWKWDISWEAAGGDDEIILSMPKDAQILTVQLQGDRPVLWATVDLDKAEEREDRMFFHLGTGHAFPAEHNNVRYWATWQLRGLVFHTFEVMKPRGEFWWGLVPEDQRDEVLRYLRESGELDV